MRDEIVIELPHLCQKSFNARSKGFCQVFDNHHRQILQFHAKARELKTHIPNLEHLPFKVWAQFLRQCLLVFYELVEPRETLDSHDVLKRLPQSIQGNLQFARDGKSCVHMQRQ